MGRDNRARWDLLGFAPPKRDGKERHVEVRVTAKGLKARAKKSFLAPRD